MNADSRLLYFSPVYWRSYPQRPHAFVRHFLDHAGSRVLWVEPHVSRLPRWNDLKAKPALFDQETGSLPGLEVLKVFALPIEPLPGGTLLNALLFWQGLRKAMREFARGARCMIGVGKPSRLASFALRTIDHHSSFYDVMDHFPAFHAGLSRRSMAKAEEDIVRRVDLLYVSSTFLEDRMSARHQRVHKVLNASEMEPSPSGTHAAAAPPLSFGYLGSIASWFDWEAVKELALLFPRAPVQLVGPVFQPPPFRLPENVRLHGACSHQRSVEFMKTFSIGLIPFRISDLTAGVDPIKYYAYRGQGLPVLTTRFGEMALRGPDEGVFFLEPGGDLKGAVAESLAWKDPDVQAFRAENCWERRLSDASVFQH